MIKALLGVSPGRASSFIKKLFSCNAFKCFKCFFRLLFHVSFGYLYSGIGRTCKAFAEVGEACEGSLIFHLPTQSERVRLQIALDLGIVERAAKLSGQWNYLDVEDYQAFLESEGFLY